MNFMEAVKAMKEGKKVITTGTNSWYYALDDSGEITCYYTDNNNSLHYNQKLRIRYEIEASWELYVEEDNWNLKDCSQLVDSLGPHSSHVDIKILKDKIIDDIKSTPIEKDIDGLTTKHLVRVIIPIINKRFGF